MLKEVLQRKPLQHPLHPILVHVPIGLFILSLILDLISTLGQPSSALVRSSFYTISFALGTATAAAISGFIDWWEIRAGRPAKRTGIYHILLNLGALAVFVFNLGLRYRLLDEATLPLLPMLLSIAGIGMLLLSGYLGGVMIYNDSSVAERLRHYRATPDSTITVSSEGAPDDLVAIDAAAKLGEGQALRANVDGRVMAIVRLDGELYAFQDFCTHCYGSLAEGILHSGQIICPEHRSCFDVRSGKVTQGPATVDLNTYEVEQRDGQIFVRAPHAQPPREREAGATEA